MDEVKPKIALIGVGKGNKFGHPNEEVLERFKFMGSSVFRTDESGEVVIWVDKKGEIVKVEDSVKEKIRL